MEGAIDIDSTRSGRTRFPAPYRAGTSASLRPAVPSRSSDSALVGLVDRYRQATDEAYGPRERSSVAPILDRYGRRAEGTLSSGAALDRDASGRSFSSERYTRGPEGRRSLAGSAPVTSRNTRTGSSARGTGAVRPESRDRAARSGSSPTRRANEAPATRARRLSALASRSPETARRIQQAGNVLADATTRGIAAGVTATSGPVAGALVRSALGGNGSATGYDAGLYLGYAYYPWWGGGYGPDCGWWYGSGWGLGWGWNWCGPSWSWAPYWGCSWYPWYCYSYNFCAPFYNQPGFYYPFLFSTVVQQGFDDGNDDVIIIVEDGGNDDVIIIDDSAEPVGEVVVGERPADSPLSLTLSIAAERYLTLGDRAFREGRFADAAQFYAKAVEYSPNAGVLHLVLADALFATGDYHYSAYAIRRALELDPALAGAVVDKHEFYSDPVDFDRHLARAELFLAENPTDGDVRLVLAANYLFGNRPAAAVDLIESFSAASLRADTAAALILESARAVQYGAPAAPTSQQ